MEAVGRKWRIGVALGLSVGLAVSGLLVWMGLSGAPLPVVSMPPPAPLAAEPIVDLARLYTVDHLVLDGDPILELDSIAAVGAGPGQPPLVPEPGAATLWILGFAALYTLYLPAGSW